MSDTMKISVGSTAKKIAVNDAGEYITIDARDQAFMTGLLDLVQDFKSMEGTYQEGLDKVNAMPTGTEEDRVAKCAAACTFNSEVCEGLRERVDKLFKDDVCRKVFGPITPGIYEFAEFFEQLAPIVKQAQAERLARIRKYTDRYHERK